jgi:TRAP-type C4-dicarboxylate transport system substrate-binding protein
VTSPAAKVVLKIATLSPEGSEWMQKMREGAKEIALKTDNRVKFKFYPGGIMGSQKAVLRKIRIGQLHGGAVTAGRLAHIYPELSLYYLPMIFKSFGEVDYVRKQMDLLLISGLEGRGFVTFGLAEGGFAYLMSRAPVRNTDDLRNQKVWMPDSDMTTLGVMEAFDIKPIPLPIADVRTSLQTGLIDAVTPCFFELDAGRLGVSGFVCLRVVYRLYGCIRGNHCSLGCLALSGPNSRWISRKIQFGPGDDFRQPGAAVSSVFAFDPIWHHRPTNEHNSWIFS